MFLSLYFSVSFFGSQYFLLSFVQCNYDVLLILYDTLFTKRYILDLQDRIIARLQQPYSLDCIPVEAEYQVSHSNESMIVWCYFIYFVLPSIYVRILVRQKLVACMWKAFCLRTLSFQLEQIIEEEFPYIGWLGPNSGVAAFIFYAYNITGLPLNYGFKHSVY